MQLTSLLAAVVLALAAVDARPLRAHRRASGMYTLPVRHVQRNTGLHVELRHQQHINRAERIAARAAGLPGPSDAQLRANLERRASFIEPAAKRFNIPSANDVSSASDSNISSLTVEDDTASDAAPAPAQLLVENSSEIDVDGVDTSFVATVQLGTPSRDFNIILDSGSGDFWVESDRCSSSGGGCGNHTFLSQDSSSSFVNHNTKWSVTYGSGSASGVLVSDTLVLAGMLVDNFTLGAASNISSSFSGDTVADGLMGLGKSGLSAQKLPTPVEVLRDAGFFSQAITSYRLPRLLDHANVGEITFGGLDESKFDPSTRVTLNATDDPFWIGALDGVTVNGVNVPVSVDTGLFDTGTTLLIVPTKDAAAIHAKIPGAKKSSSGQFTVPCDTTASVSLTFGGKSFEINPKDLPFASGGSTTGDCTSGIGTFTDTKFLVGGTFLKSVYLSTNIDENTITLAKAI